MLRMLHAGMVVVLGVAGSGLAKAQAPEAPGGPIQSLCVANPNLCAGLIERLFPAPTGCLAHSAPPDSSPNVAYQQFPAQGALATAWRVAFDHGPSQGLYITGAFFKPGPTRPWVRVLWRAGLSELFVPYAVGSPRYLDLSTYSFDLVDATSADAGPCGILLGSPAKVIKEVRDKGPLWKDDKKIRRGQVMALWGTLDAANYNYIIEYDFHDDGTISFRTGATAANLPGHQEMAHVHNAIWRLDVDLDGWAGDSVKVLRHNEPLGSASWTDDIVAFNGGHEGWVDWLPTDVRRPWFSTQL